MSKTKSITLREARQAAGLTIQELSAKSGIGWATIQGIETGRFAGGFVTRHRIADALGVPMRVLWPDSLDEMGELFAALKREQQREREHGHAAAK